MPDFQILQPNSSCLPAFFMKTIFSKFSLCLILALCAGNFSPIKAQNNAAPRIENLTASANWQTQTVTLSFDALDTENDPLTISLFVSDNFGKTYALGNAVSASGYIGSGLAPGNGKTITVSLSTPANGVQNLMLRVVADDKMPFDWQALVNSVDSNRLRSDLDFVQGIRHRSTGAQHLVAVRDSLRNLFKNSDFFTEDHTFTFSNTTGINVVGSAAGTTAAEKVVIIDAHYDTVSNAPGADDNGSGVVGVMEIARLLSRYPSEKTLRFIGFDFEESGLIGSTRYATNGLGAGETVEGVFNFEMIGYYSEAPNSQSLPTGFNLLFPSQTAQIEANQRRGDFIANVGNANSAGLSALFQTTAATYVPDLKVITLNVPGNGSVAPDLRRSDHAPFWDKGYKALMLTDAADFRNACYHKPCDTFENKLNFTFMSRIVQTTLGSAAQLAGLIHGDAASVTVQNPSDTHTPAFDCGLSAWYSPVQRAVLVEMQDCMRSKFQFELYDTRGVLLHSSSMDGSGKERLSIDLRGDLPPGIYTALFRSDAQQVVRRLAIR